MEEFQTEELEQFSSEDKVKKPNIENLEELKSEEQKYKEYLDELNKSDNLISKNPLADTLYHLEIRLKEYLNARLEGVDLEDKQIGVHYIFQYSGLLTDIWKIDLWLSWECGAHYCADFTGKVSHDLKNAIRSYLLWKFKDKIVDVLINESNTLCIKWHKELFPDNQKEKELYINSLKDLNLVHPAFAFFQNENGKMTDLNEIPKKFKELKGLIQKIKEKKQDDVEDKPIKFYNILEIHGTNTRKWQFKLDLKLQEQNPESISIHSIFTQIICYYISWQFKGQVQKIYDDSSKSLVVEWP